MGYKPTLGEKTPDYGLLEDDLSLDMSTLLPEDEPKDPADVIVAIDKEPNSVTDIVREVYEENPEFSIKTELYDALTNLAQSQIAQPEPGITESQRRMALAEGTGAKMRLATGITAALGKVVQGAAGGDESTRMSPQVLQQMQEGSYAPRKIAEKADMIEAAELEETKARREMELKDPTSDINRQFQKGMMPLFKKLGMEGAAEFVTMDSFKPGRYLHSLMEAKRKREWKEKSALIQAGTADLQHKWEEAKQAKDWEKRLQIAAMKATAKRRSRGGGGGGVSSRKQALIDLIEEVEGKEISDARKNAILAMDKTRLGQETREYQELARAKLGVGGEDQSALPGPDEARASKMVDRARDEFQKVHQWAPIILNAQKMLDRLTDAQVVAMMAAEDFRGANPFARTRAALERVLSEKLRQISGAAVSDQEYRRFKKAMGTRKFDNPTALRDSLNELSKNAKSAYAGAAASIRRWPHLMEDAFGHDPQSRFMLRYARKSPGRTNASKPKKQKTYKFKDKQGNPVLLTEEEVKERGLWDKVKGK